MASRSSTGSSKLQDFRDDRVPRALYWTGEEVAKWIEELGFPQYKECFMSNCIDGRRLITIQACKLPDIGITDYKHIQVIASSLRELLELDDPDWNRSISLPPRSSIGMYLEKKSQTGKVMDNMNYQRYLLTVSKLDPKWKPPLSNHCLIIPQN